MLGRNVLLWGWQKGDVFFSPVACSNVSASHSHTCTGIFSHEFQQPALIRLTEQAERLTLLIKLWILFYDQVHCFLCCTQAWIPRRQGFCPDNHNQAPRSALWPWGHGIERSEFALFSAFTSEVGSHIPIAFGFSPSNKFPKNIQEWFGKVIADQD